MIRFVKIGEKAEKDSLSSESEGSRPSVYFALDLLVYCRARRPRRAVVNTMFDKNLTGKPYILMARRPKALPSVPDFAALREKPYTVRFFFTADPRGFDSLS